MAKSELGTKRVCPDTGRKFYDLGKTPVISPYTGKVVPISFPPAAPRKLETAAPVQRTTDEVVKPESAEAEFVSLDEAEAEQQGKKPAKAGAAAIDDEDDVEVGDESLDDAAFIEEEEGDADVSDIIGEPIEKEEEN